jgi:alkylation response protein AidB-like acyl-CoA dehydrogenase
VRTKAEGKPQEGISFLLIDLDTPGIEMRPIRLIEGGYEVNEVFFTDVRVPVANLVGAENEGWTIAKYLLGPRADEYRGRGVLPAGAGTGEIARADRAAGRQAPDPEHAFRRAHRAVEAELEAMKITNLRMLARAAEGGTLGAEPSMLKIKGTQIRQTINDLARRALGTRRRPLPVRGSGGQPARGPRRARQ